MEREDVYESAWFRIKVREVLCTVIMMYDAIEIENALGRSNPFIKGRRDESRAVKKLYRDLYKPEDMTPEQVDEAVARALDIYKRRCGHEDRDRQRKTS